MPVLTAEAIGYLMNANAGFLNRDLFAANNYDEGPSMSEAYCSEGYVIAKQSFGTESLSLLRETLRVVLEKSGNEDDRFLNLEELILKREAQNHSLVYEAAQSVGSSAATYNLLGSSGILDTVAAATGFERSSLHLMPLYLVIQLPSDERFDYVWHQDGSYYAWCKDFLTLWFPVNRSTKRDTGTISVIPGSHQRGPRETETFFRHGYFKQMQSQLSDGEEAQEQALEVDLGDCCIMNGNTVHRSVANRSASPRAAGVLRIASLAGRQAYERDRFYCSHKS